MFTGETGQSLVRPSTGWKSFGLNPGNALGGEDAIALSPLIMCFDS